MKAWMFLVFLTLTSCSGVFMNRSFVNEMEREEGMWTPGRDFAVASGDTGINRQTRSELMERTPLNRFQKIEYEREKSIDSELKQKEMAMNPQDFQDYQQYNEYFQTPSEKIFYLNLTATEKAEYLESRRIGKAPRQMRAPASVSDDDIASFYRSSEREKPELYIGMKKNDVLERWGRPSRVDVAGDPQYENERWAFYQNGKIKNVYFENGKVHGWELD